MTVVMALLGILATAAMPLVELTNKRNKERELKHAVWEIRRAIDAYKSAYDAGRIASVAGASGYPPSLSILVTGVPSSAVNERAIYLLRRLPRDPFASSGLKAEESWGIRSYDSPPDRPETGIDVFDVYSNSRDVGLNGVPYREW
jgi:general secretion pathway protein G